MPDLSRKDILASANKANRLARRYIKQRMDNSDFGPEGTEGAPVYSTRAMWFNVHEPSGAAGKFRAAAGADGDADFVRLEGGYQEFRSIYKSTGGRRVKIDLTGSVRDALQVETNADDTSLSVEVNFKGSHNDRYRFTTVEERARYVNKQYQFMWLSEQEQNRWVKVFAEDLLERYRKE